MLLLYLLMKTSKESFLLKFFQLHEPFFQSFTVHHTCERYYVHTRLCMLHRDYNFCFILQPRKCLCHHGFAHGPIIPQDCWYMQVPISSLHMVDHVQCFTYFVKSFYMNMFVHVWSYHTSWSSFAPLYFSFLLADRVSYRADGLPLCGLCTICLYPSRQVGVQAVSSIILGFHPHLRLPKSQAHHYSVFTPVLKTLLVRTPPPCGRSMQYPFQSIEPLFFRHFSFKFVQEIICLYQPIIHRQISYLCYHVAQ